jgi:O-methyltransferase/methyltransferase family protein
MTAAPAATSVNAQERPHPAEQIFQMGMGFMTTAALGCAADLQIADRLKQGPKSVAQLAAESGVKEEPLYRVLRALAAAGVFEEQTPKTFALTPVAEVLCRDAKGSMYNMVRWFAARLHFELFPEMMHSLKTGETVVEKVYGVSCFEYLEKNKEISDIFNDAMTDFSAVVIPAALEAYDFGCLNGKTLIDIAGGHGKVLTEILLKYPAVHGKLFDLEHVVGGAKPRIESLGLAARCSVCSGDFFKEVPRADAYIMKNIIHDWDDAKATTILKNIHRASPADARVILLECVIDPGNAPSAGKWLDLEMLLIPGGKERTEEEYKALFAGAGFRVTKFVPTKSPMFVIEAVKAN